MAQSIKAGAKAFEGPAVQPGGFTYLHTSATESLFL